VHSWSELWPVSARRALRARGFAPRFGVPVGAPAAGE